MLIGLRCAIAALVLIAVTPPLVVFWFWPHNSVLSNEYDEVYERHLLIAENLGAALDLYHRDVVATFETFAPLIASGAPVNSDNLFRNLHFRHICVADPETGQVLTEVLTEKAPCPAVVPAERLSMFRDLASGGETAMSGVKTPNDGEPRLFIVTEADGMIVIGAIGTQFFRELQSRISFGRQGHAAIVDRAGRVLAHPLERWEMEARDISGISAVERMMDGETGVQEFYSPALEGDMIAGFTSVPGPGWGVMVPQPVAELEEVADRINREALGVLALSLIFSLGAALYLATRIVSRVRRIERATTLMAQGENDVEVKKSGAFLQIRELDNLRKSFNDMSAQLGSARTRLIEDSYRSGHSDMAASTLHNLRNAMNPLINRIADAREILAEAPGRRMGEAIDELTDPKVDDQRKDKLLAYCRMSAVESERWRASLAEALRITTTQFARIKEILIAEEQVSHESPVISLVELRPLVQEALQLVPVESLEDVNVEIDASIDTVGPINASRLLLLQVLQNLLANSVEALKASGSSSKRIEIAASEETVDGEPMVQIRVSDTGVGIAPTQLEEIFVSGFTGKSDGRGGLGLHWCANTVNRMRGRIFAQSEGVGRGAELNVLLPRAV